MRYELKSNWLEDERKSAELAEVLTPTEIEKEYNLPKNTVLQDVRRGRIPSKHFRRSNRIWLLTREIANRTYGDYNLRRKRRD